MVQDENKVKRL